MRRQGSAMRRTVHTIASVVMLAAFHPAVAAPPSFADPLVRAEVADYIARLQKDWSIPGVGLAIVEDGRPVWVTGFGVREQNLPAAVDGDTMFGLASITKSFVAAAVMRMVEQGLVRLDDPVRMHLPGFRVADDYVSNNVTIRDLLASRSGIDSYADCLEEVPGLKSTDVVAAITSAGQSIPFRASYEYNSLGFVIVAELIRAKTGRRWSDYMAEQVWRPLGMTQTYGESADFVPEANLLPTGDGWLDSLPRGQSALAPGANVASPHVQWEAYHRGRYFYDARELANNSVPFHRTAIDPSQAAFSSPNDMARWMAAFMNNPRYAEMMKAVSIIDPAWPARRLAAGRPDEITAVAYGLGTRIYDYGGHPLVGHTGGELGYNAFMLMAPPSGFGISIMLNNNAYSREARTALMQYLMDIRYGYSPRDWSTRFLNEAGLAHANDIASITREMAPAPADREGAPPETIVARYLHPVCGKLTILARNGRLTATAGPSYKFDLQRLGMDRYASLPQGALRRPTIMRIERDAAGRSAALLLEGDGAPIRFVRQDAE
jgi:CubicO group peptidase (beta-lactamase class C family)